MKQYALLVLTLFPFTLTAQNSTQIRVCTYNVLHVGDNDQDRAAAFRTVFGEIRPDILVCQEMDSEEGITMLLDSALNVAGRPTYAGVAFNNGPDTDNALFYNTEIVQFIKVRYHTTDLRDIAEYTMLPLGTTDTLVVLSAHLKAGDDSVSSAKRLEEAKVVRSVVGNLPETWHVVLAGDLNVYTAEEEAYRWLTNVLAENKTPPLFDPIEQAGAWNNNPAFAAIHTQSTRARRFGGGVEGGVDSRFDFLLVSGSLLPQYVPGSYTAFGNDGKHFNDSINAMPNDAVPQHVAQALHDASDHLPVYMDIAFGKVVSSVEAELGRHRIFGLW